MVKCKYHGPTCENPVRCENLRPRKYEYDGEVERIDPARLQAGHVVRMSYKFGSPSFTDSVVTRIYARSHQSLTGEGYTFDTLQEALTFRETEGNRGRHYEIYVKLARPMVYEHVGSFVVSCETYEVNGSNMVHTHKVVVMSSGAYDRRTVTFSTLHREVKEAEERQAEWDNR